MSQLLDWPVLLGAMLIFAARVLDVSIGTVRSIYTIRGQRGISVGLGFVESLIFISAISGVLAGEMSWPKMIAYAGGFACGIAVGLTVEQRIASGWWVIRVIAREKGEQLAERLRDEGHAVTEMAGRGRDGPVPILLAVVRRKRAKLVLAAIREAAPGAVVTVESAGNVINAHTAGSSGLRPRPVLTGVHAADVTRSPDGEPHAMAA